MSTLSVLIVDDSETDRYLLTRDLRRAGVEASIFEASDGDEALAFLSDYDTKKAQFTERFPPLVIFLDVNMPRMDGFTFLEHFAELRGSRSDYGSVVIMMFSSSQHACEHQRALEVDFVQDFLIKGAIDHAKLRSELEAIQRRSAAGSPAR